jgi:hypothetical protein
MAILPVKDDAIHLHNFFKTLSAIQYPKEKIRLVISVGESSDDTLELTEDYCTQYNFNYELYHDPVFDNKTDSSMWIADIMNYLFSFLQDEEYIWVLDGDIERMPPTIVTDLMRWDKDIIAPTPLMFRNIDKRLIFYDTYCFRFPDGKKSTILNNVRDHPYFYGTEPVEMQSIGTMGLVKRQVALDVKWTNPSPWLQFNKSAILKGYKVWALPNVIILHADVYRFREDHKPVEYHISAGEIPRELYEQVKEISTKDLLHQGS